MDELLHKKVRSAAIAGWWTLLVALIVQVVTWGAFVTMWRCRPAWVQGAWGGVPWETMQPIALWMFAVYKLIVWTMFLVVVWLSIWSSKLKRIA